MNKLKHILILILVLQGVTICAQKVSNINYHQEQSNIIVSYDLETKTPCKVSLYVSTNDRTSWQGPLTKVTGDVGDKIISGRHVITWNVLEEFEELRGDKIKFQLRAKVDNIETVIFDTQEWTTKNLDVSKYRNGDIIPEVKDPKKWAELTTGAWCYYNNDDENGKIYGKLYNWYAVNDPRGLAPEGFHIPSDIEWTKLIDLLGGINIAGGKMKVIGISDWKSTIKDSSNQNEFIGLPAGLLDYYGVFKNIGIFCYWWSSTETNTLTAWNHYLNFNYNFIIRGTNFKTNAMSIRCIRD